MRRQYAGGAKPTTLSASLGGSTADLSISGVDFSNYPDGSIGPFYIVIDRGQVTEEKILCVSRSGNTITVYNTGLTNGRGNDGTSVVGHSAGSIAEHVFTSVDADEANSHVNNHAIHGGSATGGGSNEVFFENDLIISEDYTVTTSKNAGTFGPISIDSGATVTIPSGSVWSVV